MESRFKTRMSRIFSSSLGSCSSHNLSEAMRKAVISPQSKRCLTMIEPLSPKCKPFPSICKPSCPDNEFHPRREVSRKLLNYLNDQFECQENAMRAKKTSKKKKSRNIELCPLNSFSNSQDTYFSGWFDSGDETETCSSSKSVSSVSSEPHRRRKSWEKQVIKPRRAAGCPGEVKDFPSDGKVKDSFAIVKQSIDPYGDFRTSMVEMIVEKQIVAAKDLEHLLQCFLSLNSECYHMVIVEVFIEICEALIYNCSN